MKILKKMKQYMVILPFSAMTLVVGLPSGATAQIAVVEVIRAGVKKVIKAVDLKVQRLQNKTIWLQNAQKTLENQLSKLKLGEIAEWTKQQKDLYGKYYKELWEAKSAITYFQRIRELTDRQVAIVREYQRARDLFRGDEHFTTAELLHMEEVYGGILDASIQNIDQILLVAHSFKTQMSDAERLEILNEATGRIEANYNDLRQFNTENSLLSIQRATSSQEVERLKSIYEMD